MTLNYPLQKTGEYVIEFGKKQKLETIDGEVELDPTTKKYFTLIAYGDEEASNPIESDNKITVLSEKISYKPGETARVLVRLPFSN